MSITAIRGKDWVFNALWAACQGPSEFMGRTNGGDAIDDGDGSLRSKTSSSSCILSIPFTCIFQNGLPAKCLMTDKTSGQIKRVFLDSQEPSRSDSKLGFRGLSLQSLRALHKYLHAFHESEGYDSAQLNNDDVYIAKVKSSVIFHAFD